MPELPDVTVYVEALHARIVGRRLERVLVGSPFLLRSAAPPLESTFGRVVTGVRRVGKQIAIGVEGDLWLVLHLKIAGRLHWKKAAPKLGARNLLAIFQFDSGALTLTEAGSERRAGLHVVAGEAGLRALDAGGIEPLEADVHRFAAALRAENHTLKRALTDPRLLSGIGNAYSDEILFEARIRPLRRGSTLKPDERRALYEAMRSTLARAVDTVRAQYDAGKHPLHKQDRSFLRIHGKNKSTCPRCGHRVSTIHTGGETTYFCRGCQT